MDAGLPRPSARVEKGARQVKPSAQGLLSVIVPFYNASAYLQNCLEALRRRANTAIMN